MLLERHARIRERLAQVGVDWLLVPASAYFRGLTGAVARATERLLVLGIPAQGEPFCLVPRLEAEALREACDWLEQIVWGDEEQPFDRLAARIGLDRRPRLMLGDGFRTGVLLALAERTSCRTAFSLLGGLRAVKDASEIARIEEASRHADQVMAAAAATLRPGLTEREVERFILDRFESLGDEGAWAIVASGPNSAYPHHFTSRRVIEANDVVLLDLGAYTGGYGSDITRAFWMGRPPPEAEQVHEVVNQARQAGIAAARVGAGWGEVDAAARSVIEHAGYGDRFPHRTGHGVGLEVHELPNLAAGDPTRLLAGMVHSVEPGIYLPGRFGIRLEDLVVVEYAGGRRLNHAPLEPRPARDRS